MFILVSRIFLEMFRVLKKFFINNVDAALSFLTNNTFKPMLQCVLRKKSSSFQENLAKRIAPNTFIKIKILKLDGFLSLS